MTNPLYNRACKAFDAMHQTETYLRSFIGDKRFNNLYQEFPSEFERALEIERSITGDTPPDIAEVLFLEWENIWMKIAKACRKT